jgi:3-phosphoshikimate 1-carboxyvinyltransferase
MTALLRVPGSKSMTQRALVIAALSAHPRTIRGALVCDDSERLTAILRGLGAQISWDVNDVRVQPAPLAGSGQAFDCENAGTAARFGAALSLVTEGAFVLDGNQRMRERPIGPLVAALTQLGVDVAYLGGSNFLPARFERKSAGSQATIDGTTSSQFASALMLAGPCMPSGLQLTITGEAVSADYLRMTESMMIASGASLSVGEEISVLPGGYPAREEITIEGDWSSAAFLLAAGWLTGQPLAIENLPQASIQGDAVFPQLLDELTAERSHHFDLRNTPDLIAPLAAAALFAAQPSSIRGVAHARLKESDRLSALAIELRKVGASIEELTDGLEIEPLRQPRGAVLDPHRDHRLAMAFGVISLRIPDIEVLDPDCVSKSFPSFWSTLEVIRNG